jgi:hypothetical protein
VGALGGVELRARASASRTLPETPVALPRSVRNSASSLVASMKPEYVRDGRRGVPWQYPFHRASQPAELLLIWWA